MGTLQQQPTFQGPYNTLRDPFCRFVWLAIIANAAIWFALMYFSPTLSLVIVPLAALDAASMWIATSVMVRSVKGESSPLRKAAISILIATGLGAINSTLKCLMLYTGTDLWTFSAVLDLICYLSGLLGTALFFSRDAWREGSTFRLVIDNVVVSIAMYLLSTTVLSHLVRADEMEALSVNLMYPALDIAVLFTILPFALRYGRSFRPVIGFFICSDLLLIAADTVFVILQYLFHERTMSAFLLPIYNLQGTLLPLGLYCASKITLREEEHRTLLTKHINRAEWFWWTTVSRTFIAIAISVAVVMGTEHIWLIGFVMVLTLVRDIVAATDQRRVGEELKRITLQSQAFMERVVHDAAAPIQYVQTAVARIEDEQLQMQTEHLINVVNQTRSYLQSLSITPMMEWMNIRPICVAASAAAVEYAQSNQQKVVIALDIPTNLPHIYVDALALRRILDNLLRNAVQAMPEGGDIELTVTVTAKRAVIQVQDMGPGIPQELRHRVFEPHISSRPGGSGLGLAIVAELASAMKATYGLEGRADHRAGSVFWISLPQHQQTAPAVVTEKHPALA